MYPSGAWRAYWDQPGLGRGEMTLQLHFADGHVKGQGVDVIGPFLFQGQYDPTGRVVMIKQYLGRHAVLYDGQHNGEGVIQGQWSIPPDYSGSFAMTPILAKGTGDLDQVESLF